MKICVFNHEVIMSGAPSALYDWISCDKDDEFLIIMPKVLVDSPFLNLENVETFEGNFHCPLKNVLKNGNIWEGNIKPLLVYLHEISIGKLLNKPWIKSRIKKFKPDIIISNSFAIYLGADIARSLKIPHVWHIREHMESDFGVTHINQRKINELTKNSYAIFISKSIQNYYLNKYDFLGYELIYDQVNISQSEIHDNNYFSNNEIHMMIAGSIQEGKGQIDVLEVTKKLQIKGYTVYLDIYGEGKEEYIDYLKRFIKNNELVNVDFKGFSNNLFYERLNHDIALICSRNEGFGRVTVESMYAGNITIGLDAPATNEIIKDELNGFLYKKDDINGLCNIIENCFNNKEDMLKIVNQARNDAKNYMHLIYKDIIKYCKTITNNLINK